MRPAVQIITELDQRDLLELLVRITREHRVTVDEVCKPCRKSHVCAARFAFYLELRELDFSFPRIAALFGVDHTSVMYGVRQAQRSKHQALAKTTAVVIDPAVLSRKVAS